MRRSRLLVVGATVILLSVGLMAAPAGATSGSPSASRLDMRGYCSFKSTVSYAQGTYVGIGVCNTEGVSPATDTPDGYLLRPGVRVQSADGKYYVYKTNTDASYELNSEGQITSRVNEHWKETVTGRTSNTWTLQMYDDWQYGEEYEAFYDYYCGINISDASDPTCSTWSGNTGATGTKHGQMWSMGFHTSGTSNPFTLSGLNFGSKSGKKFPMFNNRIQWYDGVHNIGEDLTWGYKIRGWDVCDTVSTTALCATTGDGR